MVEFDLHLTSGREKRTVDRGFRNIGNLGVFIISGGGIVVGLNILWSMMVVVVVVAVNLITIIFSFNRLFQEDICFSEVDFR